MAIIKLTFEVANGNVYGAPKNGAVNSNHIVHMESHANGAALLYLSSGKLLKASITIEGVLSEIKNAGG